MFFMSHSSRKNWVTVYRCNISTLQTPWSKSRNQSQSLKEEWWTGQDRQHLKFWWNGNMFQPKKPLGRIIGPWWRGILLSTLRQGQIWGGSIDTVSSHKTMVRGGAGDKGGDSQETRTTRGEGVSEYLSATVNSVAGGWVSWVSWEPVEEIIWVVHILKGKIYAIGCKLSMSGLVRVGELTGWNHNHL